MHMAKCYGRRLVLCSGACAAVFNTSVREVILNVYAEGDGVRLVKYHKPVAVSTAGTSPASSHEVQLSQDSELDPPARGADDDDASSSTPLYAAVTALQGVMSNYKRQ
jgi:hypothetical protein